MNYELEIEIEKSRDHVAELFGDPANLAFWQPGFQSIEEIGEKEGQLQSRLLYVNRGRDVVMIETVISDNLPDEFSAQYEADGMVMTVRNYFHEAGPEKTRWVSENEASVSGFMMRLVTILMPGCFKKESWKFMENFKAFAETGADVREKA